MLVVQSRGQVGRLGDGHVGQAGDPRAEAGEEACHDGVATGVDHTRVERVVGAGEGEVVVIGGRPSLAVERPLQGCGDLVG